LNSYFQDKRVAIRCHILLAVVVLPYVLLYDKTISLLYINGHFSPELDVIMYHITRLPEIAYIIFVVILGLFTERRMFLTVIVAMGLSAILIILFKHQLFADFNRPYYWLNGQKIPFHHVSGIRLHTNNSFPSGHTLAAFSALGLVGFISRNGWVQFFLFLLACVSGYSRVYAAQHYLMDVYAGALIGFSIALLCDYIFYRMFKTPHWLNPIIKFKA
jgi:membrane-associated phospholipid phosphatase